MTCEQLNQLHEVEVSILDEIVKICDRHHLRYCLFYGTLLGAVRHKGFIPWDDDIDIAMPREDYDKFCKLALLELPASFYLHSPNTDKDYWLPFVKVKKRNTAFEESSWSFDTIHNEIFVDIFPLDYSLTAKSPVLKIKFIKAVRRIILCKHKGIKPSDVLTRILYFFLQKDSVSDLVFLMNRVMTSGCRGRNNFFIGATESSAAKGFPVNWVFPAGLLVFEGKMYNVPFNADAILTQMYGPDYMELPPEEKRITHNPRRLSFDTELGDECL